MSGAVYVKGFTALNIKLNIHGIHGRKYFTPANGDQHLQCKE